MSAPQEAPWKGIARRKQATRNTALHEPSSISIDVPPNLLPQDPPSCNSGPQPVHHIPDQLLSAQDRHITSISIADLLAAIRSGTYTSTAVTSAYIRRASVAQQLTNCLTEPLFTRALARAAILDRDFQNGSGKLVGPLHGLTVSIKDGFNVAGYDSSIGLASLCFKPASSNAPLVDLLESLGCVIIAKTNIPQTLASLDSVNNVFGRTYNPFNRLLTAGGSSGGEGVLVAMKGSAIGFGTDIGGSIRVPAMCNGIYGYKPSVGRIPYGGQQLTGLQGLSRSSVQSVAGPIARSMEDIECVLREVVPNAWMFGEDCVSWGNEWMAVPLARDPGTARQRFKGSGPSGEFVIGVLRSDGNCQLLPPIAKMMDEVSNAVRTAGTKMNVKVVDLPTPKAWTKAQSVMSKLMGVDGGAEMSRMLLETQEPLVPWMSTRFKHGGKAQKLERVAEIQAQRTQLEKDILRDVWKVSTDEFGRKSRGVDAVICPLAPHPVPEIERYNAVGYTSSWVLFDYPAGSVPIRQVKESDLELGKPLNTSLNVLGSWDEKSRELWDENKTDRKVYLGSMLSVQCVTGRLEDEKLAYVMGLIDEAVKNAAGSREAKL
ncbi:hypothetical protein LTR70_008645 [Exophiala xenobiotica]|uniref:amidase n=1 Tax=Lithohypha guttulata TaxID=1690604 RepID=A0ABR0K020_9EURO|nr:hypothetical protein LTR24_008480 [Lithohypha guttulata]KAK5311659.1 hypothetical protein LTR70_008645 [Exophiala xenobiotica]